MRLGGPVFAAWNGPDEWAAAVRAAGYRAAYCPLEPDADDATVAAYAAAAEAAGVVIAEVGAWSNPISPDSLTRLAAIEHCQQHLALADRIGARCCVNIAGSRNAGQWDGAHPDNLSDDTFALIVETLRRIIDAVKPTRTFYTVEANPFLQPDSAEAFEKLLAAVKRDRLAVHFDPVDLINSPKRYYGNTRIIKDFVASMGTRIKACHARDVILRPAPLVHLDQVPPGEGGLDYSTYLKAVRRLNADVPILLEQLPDEAAYQRAAEHLRGVAAKANLAFA
ncbi:MAG: sugar phosphate isomerase/epimerase [Armatimonadetes bacterium]|nr:sugar phosphate isomerase/epimerase [Armatimonadota bacterium]